MSAIGRRLQQASNLGASPGGLDRSSPPVFTSSDQSGIWYDSPWAVSNEVWNGEYAGPQTIYVWDYNNWYVDSNQPAIAGHDPAEVKSYPCTYYSLGPVALSDLNTVTSTWSSSYNFAPTDYWDVAFDIWLDNFNIEVMVWNDYSDELFFPSSVPAVIDGITYHVYTNRTDNTGEGGIWMICDKTARKLTGSTNLMAHFQWLLDNGWLVGTNKLHRINYGCEISNTNGSVRQFSLDSYTLNWS